MSPFSFLILLFWILSLCPLLSLAEGLSILLIFSKNPAPYFVDSLYGSICFCWVDFSPEFHYILLSTPLGVFASFCSRTFKCTVKLLVHALSIFFLEALRAMSFPVSTAFIVFHKFWYDVFFHFHSTLVFNFFFYFFLDQAIIEKNIVQSSRI